VSNNINRIDCGFEYIKWKELNEKAKEETKNN
jgi:hypothetical protein